VRMHLLKATLEARGAHAAGGRTPEDAMLLVPDKKLDSLMPSIRLRCERRAAPLRSPQARTMRSPRSVGEIAGRDEISLIAGRDEISLIAGRDAISLLTPAPAPTTAEEAVRFDQGSYYRFLDASAAAAALVACEAQHGAMARAIYNAIEAAGTEGVAIGAVLSADLPNMAIGAVSSAPFVEAPAADVSGLRRAELAIGVLRSFRQCSLAVPVCVGDERRYVGHSHVAEFWAARPYTLVDAATADADALGADAEKDAIEPRLPAGATAPAAGSAPAAGAHHGAPPAGAPTGMAPTTARWPPQPVEWEADSLTPLGQRPLYAPPEYFFIPEAGHALDGRIDGTHYSRLRAAIVAWVACNPGLAEEELLDRFWGHPMCLVRGMLHAMEAEGTLRRSHLARPPRPLFGGATRAAAAAADAAADAAAPTHFFLDPRSSLLSDHGLVLDTARVGGSEQRCE